MSEHRCKCRECHPEAFPEVPPNIPGYVSVEHHHTSTHPQHVTVDGELMEMVTEALSGEKGWVVYYPTKADGEKKQAHLCDCGQAPCTDVRYGRVVFGPPGPIYKTAEERVREEAAR